MSEKASFFYKEITNKDQQIKRLDLRDDFTNALLGDVNPNTLIQSRQIQK